MSKTHMTEADALTILNLLSDKEFDDFLTSEHVPARVRLLIRGGMVKWQKVLPKYFIKSISV